MNLKLGSFIFAMLFGFSALAQPGTITPIEDPSLVCQGDIGVVSINADQERVWHGEPGQSDGMELEILQFDRFRCPNAYDIQAKLIFFGTKADARLTTTSCGVENIQLDYNIQGQVYNLNCHLP